MAAPGGSRSILCLSSMAWEGLWTRKQRFMHLLAGRGHRVLYVEPVTQPLARFVGKDRLRPGWRARLSRPDPRRELYVLTPPAGLPFAARHPLPFTWNSRLMQAVAGRASRRLGLGEDALVWTYLPWYPGRLRPHRLVYDCVDEHAAYPGVNAAMVRAAEGALLARADLVLVTAQGLLAERADRTRRCVYLPNGVDARAFAGPREEADGTAVADTAAGAAAAAAGAVAAADAADEAARPELARLPRPIAGFVGGLFAWIDVDLLAWVARAKPAWSFVLIGPTDRDLGPLLACGNVHYLGPRPRDRVPAYMRGFDVGLNPFRATELSRRVNPLKVYEYLAAGIPVVSTDMPEVLRLGDVVRVAANREEFAALLDAAAQERHDPARVAARRAVAWQHDWGVLFQRALDAVAETTGIVL